MPHGRTFSVRSHRRGGPRRRSSIAWLTIGAVVVLVGAGLIAGYAHSTQSRCGETASAAVQATPKIEMVLSRRAPLNSAG